MMVMPRYGTKRSPERATLGPNVATVAAALAKPFMPWQKYVTDVALEIDPVSGLPAYQSVYIVVMRQQGKTELLLPVMTHRAMGFEGQGAQTIQYTTQTKAKAREKWEDIHVKRLKESPFADLFTTRLRLSQEAMLWVNGSMWSPGSGTGKTSGTGDTLDFAAVDEMWAAEAKRELGLRPAMQTRKASQLWGCSMVPGLSRAGTQDSQWMRDKMKVGREMVRNDVRHGVAYFEFSADPRLDPSDPATWFSCMPALCPMPDARQNCHCDPQGIWHHTITERALASDFQSFDLTDFCAEYLGWWPKDNRPTWTFVKEAVWNDLHEEDSHPRSAVAAGVDMDEDRNQLAVAIAGKRTDLDWHIELIEPGSALWTVEEVTDESTAEDKEQAIRTAADRIVKLCADNDVLVVVIDPRGPAQSLIIPLERAGIEVLTPNSLDISGACGRFQDALGITEDGPDPTRLHHLDQKTLTLAIANAHKLISSKNRTFAWDRIGGSVSVAPLYAVTLAMHGYEVKMGDDYDARDSFGSRRGSDGECADCGRYPDYPDGPIDHYDDCGLTKTEESEG